MTTRVFVVGDDRLLVTTLAAICFVETPMFLLAITVTINNFEAFSAYQSLFFGTICTTDTETATFIFHWNRNISTCHTVTKNKYHRYMSGTF